MACELLSTFPHDGKMSPQLIKQPFKGVHGAVSRTVCILLPQTNGQSTRTETCGKVVPRPIVKSQEDMPTNTSAVTSSTTRHTTTFGWFLHTFKSKIKTLFTNFEDFFPPIPNTKFNRLLTHLLHLKLLNMIHVHSSFHT